MGTDPEAPGGDARVEAVADRFAAALSEAGGTAHRVAGVSGAVDAIAGIVGDQAGGSRRVLCARDELLDPRIVAGLRNREIDLLDTGDVREAAQVTVGLTAAAMGVAETGSILVGGRRGGWGRASALPWVHVAVLRRSEVHRDLAAAFDAFLSRMREGEREWVWITGPSRTADIAKTLVHGVHGPNALHVVLLE